MIVNNKKIRIPYNQQHPAKISMNQIWSNSSLANAKETIAFSSRNRQNNNYLSLE